MADASGFAGMITGGNYVHSLFAIDCPDALTDMCLFPCIASPDINNTLGKPIPGDFLGACLVANFCPTCVLCFYADKMQNGGGTPLEPVPVLLVKGWCCGLCWQHQLRKEIDLRKTGAAGGQLMYNQAAPQMQNMGQAAPQMQMQNMGQAAPMQQMQMQNMGQAAPQMQMQNMGQAAPMQQMQMQNMGQAAPQMQMQNMGQAAPREQMQMQAAPQMQNNMGQVAPQMQMQNNMGQAAPQMQMQNNMGQVAPQMQNNMGQVAPQMQVQNNVGQAAPQMQNSQQ